MLFVRTMVTYNTDKDCMRDVLYGYIYLSNCQYTQILVTLLKSVELDILIVDKYFSLKYVVPKSAKIMNPDILWNAALFTKCLANTAH